MTKGIKCDGPECDEFITGEPDRIVNKWYQLFKTDVGELSYHFHNLDCLINWTILVKEDENEPSEPEPLPDPPEPSQAIKGT